MAIRRTVYQTNPNLLDNWYFARPVNQRGVKSWTTGYGIDRWKQWAGNSTLTPTDEGLHIVSTNAIGCIMDQMSEHDLNGLTVTVSLLVKNATGDILIQSGNGRCRESGLNNEDAFISTTIKNWNNKSPEKQDFLFRIYNASATAEFTVVAAKLELGDTQTLAHKENGVWVLNEIPNYDLELLKCMRYFQTFATQTERPDGTNPEDYRPPMRANATLDQITVNSKTLYTASADL